MDNLLDWDAAVEEVTGWPEYSPQPLHALPNWARHLGLASLYYKDESQRFGRELGSFKALGAPYAVYALLRDTVEAETGARPTAKQLRSGRFEDITGRVTVCVATDGNQGRGLAYAARTFGCRCVIYIHGHVSSGRKTAIEALGATVIRINGEYEESVERAKEDARVNGWHFVSSTSWEDFAESIPRNVMNAYMVMVEEALSQVPDLSAVTHVFMQGGVGSIAAAIFLGVAQRSSSRLPRFVVVEPVEADCLYRSAVAGRPVASSGSLKTIMAGLACREVSPAAWKILDWLASDFVAIPDSWVVEAMRALADGGSGDSPIVSGESAAGGMAVLLKAAQDAELGARLGLDEDSTVILFGAEGATDPLLYEEIVGRSPGEVFDLQEKAPVSPMPATP
ncbi:diaminopropionate ammonia-lyase [Nonomuraea sp. KM88]|uniref:diaminopropionate ammonia-lyase n=1 Tax=Nonomuraea sp. KM88 TaxID=3457427 RepID=UPI003FCE055C